jgi:hypothetical protein
MINRSCVKRMEKSRDFSVPTQSGRDLRSSAMLRSVDWWIVTDVSGQPLNSFLALEDGAHMFSRNVGT